MKPGTRNRAVTAIVLLKALAGARLHHSELILPNGTVVNDRELDACFEAGDDTEVIVLIVHAMHLDPELRDAVDRDYARDFVDIAGWARIVAEREAKQPDLLPLE